MQKWHTHYVNRENRDQPVDWAPKNPKPGIAGIAVWSETDFWDGHTFLYIHIFLAMFFIPLENSNYSQIHFLKFGCVSSLSLAHSPLVVLCQLFVLNSPYFGIQITTLGYASWLLRLHRSLSTGFVSTYGSRFFSLANHHWLIKSLFADAYHLTKHDLIVHEKRPSNWLVKPLCLIGEATIKSVVLLFRDGDEIAGVVVAESGGLQTSAALASAIMQDRTPTAPSVEGGLDDVCFIKVSEVQGVQ